MRLADVASPNGVPRGTDAQQCSRAISASEKRFEPSLAVYGIPAQAHAFEGLAFLEGRVRQPSGGFEKSSALLDRPALWRRSQNRGELLLVYFLPVLYDF
jgi:hypothetical protein